MVRLILKLNALLWCNFHYTVKNEILPFLYKIIPTLSLPRFEKLIWWHYAVFDTGVEKCF
jgi:hypothetical protein